MGLDFDHTDVTGRLPAPMGGRNCFNNFVFNDEEANTEEEKRKIVQALNSRTWKACHWRPASNFKLAYLCTKIFRRVASQFDVTWRHVYGHSGNYHNERADCLAKFGARSRWIRSSRHPLANPDLFRGHLSPGLWTQCHFWRNYRGLRATFSPRPSARNFGSFFSGTAWAPREAFSIAFRSQNGSEMVPKGAKMDLASVIWCSLRSSSHLIANPDLLQGHFDGTKGCQNGSGKRNLIQLRSSSHLIVNPDLFQGHFDGTYGVKMDLASVNWCSFVHQAT